MVDTDTSMLEAASHRLMGALKGKSIFNQGDPADAVYRVEHGCVRLQVDDEDGSRQVIAFVFAGQTFSAGLDVHWASAIAVTDTVLTSFPHASLWALMDVDSRPAIALLSSADQLLTDLAQHLNRLTHSGAQERLSWFLEWLAQHCTEADPRIIRMPMGRQDVADFLGIAPETVSRLMRQMTMCGTLRPLGSRRYRYDSRANVTGRRPSVVRSTRFARPTAGMQDLLAS